MSDLFNKLVMRRKGRHLTHCLSSGAGEVVPQCLSHCLSLPGISGKGPATGTSEGPGGAFTRMSDSIPPLPPPQQPAGDEDEDDWES